jgi:hypothetical protein
MPPLPNTSSWRGAQLKYRDTSTFILPLNATSRNCRMHHARQQRIEKLAPDCYNRNTHTHTHTHAQVTYLRMSFRDDLRLVEVPGCSILLQAPITSCVLNTLRLFERAKSCLRHLFELFLLWFPFIITEADVDKFICCCWVSEFCIRVEESSAATPVLLK